MTPERRIQELETRVAILQTLLVSLMKNADQKMDRRLYAEIVRGFLGRLRQPEEAATLALLQDLGYRYLSHTDAVEVLQEIVNSLDDA